MNSLISLRHMDFSAFFVPYIFGEVLLIAANFETVNKRPFETYDFICYKTKHCIRMVCAQFLFYDILIHLNPASVNLWIYEQKHAVRK